MKIHFRHPKLRSGQDKMINDILEAINSKKSILIHAPTGIGKTDASLSAAITYAIENNLKILFLTPKISQHKIALEVIEGINKKYNMKLRAIDFVGKRNMCIDPGISQVISNFYEVCKKTREKNQCPFYNNIKPKNKSKREVLNYKINKSFQDKYCINHQEIRNMAEEFKSLSGKEMPLCAYELAKIYARKCDIIIADYYHLFSKKISDSLLGELNIKLEECIVIIDEAHNLEDRLLKLLSKSLNTYHLNRAIKESKELKNTKLRLFLQNFLENIEVLAKNKLKKNKEAFITKDDLLGSYSKDILEIIDVLEQAGLDYIEKTEDTRSALITISLFLESWIVEQETSIRLIKKENKLISVKYNALDVSILTKEVLKTCYSTILMSATLTPLNMYKDILGIDDASSITREYMSPFDSRKRLNLLVTDVSTKYTKRNDKEFIKIAEHINKIVNSVPGNCIVFFPSFELMKNILRYIKINKPKLIQEEKMNSVDFEDMISKFKLHSKRFGAVLFAVMGGKASEGIDLPGGNLIAAIVVGIPLAKMQLESMAKIDYYEKKYKKGWLYAYIQPAIQKTIQSAGRVIRDNKDKGIVVFMDERYMWENYRRCLPQDLRFRKSRDISKDITSFFEKEEI